MRPAPAALLPAIPQPMWGWPAVVNFAAGGTGAGLYVAAVLAAGAGPPGGLDVAAGLGPALVLAGFAAVATEAGRPLRGPRALRRVSSSWMSRELWLGGLFVVLALLDRVRPGAPQRAGAVVAALGLALAQGYILRQARAVPAWSVPLVPPLFLASALVSGGAALVLVAALGGPGPTVPLTGGVLVALTVFVALWWAVATWPGEAAVLAAARPLREGALALGIAGVGYLVPSLLLATAVAWPALARPLAGVGAAAALAGQVALKAGVVLAAGRLRPVTLAHPALMRRPV